MHGRRFRGRLTLRKNWMKCLFMLEDAAAFSGNTDINLEGASEMAYSDRKHWREMKRHKRELIGAGQVQIKSHLIVCDLLKFG